MGISERGAHLEFLGERLWWVMARRKNLIFTNKKHSEKAIMATILGIISLFSLGTVIFLTYTRGGEATVGYGVTAILAVLFSLAGLILGITTVREVDRYRLFPCLGILLNLAALVGVGLILYIGVYGI